jgi:hypothetical protein
MNWMDDIFKWTHLFFVEASWPIVVCLIVFYFREQIKDFSKRVVEIGLTGAKAVAPPTQITHPLSEVGDSAAFLGTVENRPTGSGFSLPVPDPAVAEVERTVLENIEQLKARGIDTDNLSKEEQKNLFVREYAILLLRCKFQFIGSQIFGTQMALLRRLDSSPPQSQDALVPIFEDHKKRLAEAGIAFVPDFYSWIGFLLSTKLVTVNSDGFYSITPFGKLFLNVYAPASKLTEATRLF